MDFTHRVRALISKEHGKIMFIKRVRPGAPPYWVTPGGGLEESDPSIEAAMEREVAEELGAKVNILKLVFVIERQTAEHLITRESFFLCQLLDYDLSKRTGPEFSDASRGEYILDVIDLVPDIIASTNIKPDELKQFLFEHCSDLLSLPDLRNSPTA